MRYSNLFGKTLREDPAETETPSHRLLIKAGMIRQLASGIYSYMPLAWRALKKIEAIIRSEMDAAGSQELRLPALQPADIWDDSGRNELFGDNLFRMKDRRERNLVIAPTHEEAITLLAKASVDSYRDLPLILYQIQTKFRDELRPRAGLIRVREFDMKDAYSFDTDEACLDQTYEIMVQAYKNIYQRCGLNVIQAEADSGAIGGKDSHEFLVPVDSGEDVIVFCTNCGYAANLERAEGIRPDIPNEPFRAIEEVSTPGIKTIDELSSFLQIHPNKTLKSMLYSIGSELVLVVIRGDLEVNEVKLKNLLGGAEIRLATEEEVKKAGMVAGFLSPVKSPEIKVISDLSVAIGSNFVTGANHQDHHLINANQPRDFDAGSFTDIALTQAGHPCIRCETPLSSQRGIEVGHVFKLGTVFTDKFNANYIDKDGKEHPMVMGCYGIGVGRLLAAAIEQNHDEKGIIFPANIAPYDVHLVSLNTEDPSIKESAESLYSLLVQSGLGVFYDDRDESPGVKFNDADLLGFPIRIIVSPRNLKANQVEIKIRRQTKPEAIGMDNIVDKIREILSAY
ncbi:MAG: proline--tRNA ligase [SAR202 cluster bacterium]|nr:proline--tRNA ligase [SAR202 cluster bacterium]|tara:strand:+ start:3504 stop:5204 length:1701 start_codon:yes stop_codon:yes gene_type:complete